ncbi:MAG: alpha/beta hydrolase [Candidatus Electrothrix sp. AUS4]|nr:alpha/beta hydrolase [Candidatus Electrothrix sp. AUS4]
MKYKIIILAFLILILPLSFLIAFQKSRIKTCARIFLSQVYNSEWIFGEDFGYKYRLFCPENLEKKNNRKYPLLVYLHGAGERGNDNRLQIYDLPYLGTGGGKNKKVFQKKYPSIVYVPQCPKNKTWNDKDTLTALTKTIDKLTDKYPIDKDRLYLIGYSMGGSGTYALASQYYLSTKQPVAAIVRLAGQSSFDRKTHEIISKSSVWLHVGLHDIDLRIEKAREAYAILKEIHKNAIETSKQTNIAQHPGTTVTLRLNHVERAKKSEYMNDGHGISNFPFEDSSLMEWIFRQQLRR